MLMLVKVAHRARGKNADDVIGRLDGWLAPGYHTEEAAWEAARARERATPFVPPGEKVHEFQLLPRAPAGAAAPAPRTLEIWRGTWTDESPRVKALFPRLQTLGLFFIEAATTLDPEDEEPGWEIYTGGLPFFSSLLHRAYLINPGFRISF